MQLLESETDIRRVSYHGDRDRRRIGNRIKPFIAWDGEGYTDDTGEHHYNLFGSSAGKYVLGDSLNLEECFELLLDTAAENDAIHIIFAGTYDLVMMIHKRDLKVCRRVMKGQPVWIGPYRVEFFRNKWLNLRHKDGRRIVLYDVFTFFACSFVKACQQFLGNDETLQEIEQVKKERSTFQLEDLETKVVPYWMKELDYLVRLCSVLRERLLAAGIVMTRWHGPGAIATSVLQKHRIKLHMGDTPDVITELARHAYYGGRFEQFKLGHYDGPVYQYDINSAYPSAIAQLPSLTDVQWRHTPVSESYNRYGLYQIRFNSPEKFFGLYPLPWRSERGRIYYPKTIGAPSWYWGVECINLEHHHADFEILECWVPDNSDARPFDFVQEMYDERQKMKDAGDPTQLAVKLALNSLYGKLAQSKGAKKDRMGNWKLPAFHQLVWAGWITAAARAKLYEGMCQNPDAIIAVETDAIFSTARLDLPVSNKLGEWSVQVYDAITFIQSGVYFAKIGDKWKLKSRGFESGNHAHDAWLRLLSRSPMREDSVAFAINRFGTIPGMRNWARWYSHERETVFVPMTTKRVHIINICPTCRQHKSLAEGLHPLAVPHSQIPSSNRCSSPHPLPWADDMYYTWQAKWDEADYDSFRMEITV